MRYNLARAAALEAKANARLTHHRRAVFDADEGTANRHQRAIRRVKAIMHGLWNARLAQRGHLASERLLRTWA